MAKSICTFFLTLFAACLVELTLAVSPVLAQSSGATFVLDPNEGSVILGQQFSIDILLQSGGNAISSARAALHFDPAMLEVTKVQYDSLDQQNGKLFCQFPQSTDNYVVDNDQGLVVVTGISSGGTDCPYFSDTEGIFARVFFKSLDTGSTTVSFVIGSQSAASSISDTKSPPQPVLTAQPASATFTIVSKVSTSPLPGTGILSDGLAGVSVVLLLGGIGLVVWQLRRKY